MTGELGITESSRSSTQSVSLKSFTLEDIDHKDVSSLSLSVFSESPNGNE